MRLVTRSDFDSIVSAALLRELGVVNDIFFTHPKELQDGKVAVTKNDVLVNVPYVEGCGLWLDHHSSEGERLNLQGKYKGCSKPAPSAARVVYEYYNCSEGPSKFNKLMKIDEIMENVDKADSANFTIDEILNPEGRVLLSFICDPRTGLDHSHHYSISHMQLMTELVEYLRTKSIDEIMELPDIKERVSRYFENDKHHKAFLRKYSKVDGTIVITDLRGISDMPPGNRHIVYALYPDSNISIRIVDGEKDKFVTFSVGHSILNRTSNVDVGSLTLRYGGGGHKAVGTCRISCGDDSDRVLNKIVEAIKGS